MLKTIQTKGIEHLDDRDPLVKTRALAYKFLSQDSNPHYAVLGASVYEALGKGEKAVPRLYHSINEASEKGELTNEVYEEANAFIKRNTGERQAGESVLEGKLPAFIALTVGGIALGVGSLTMTGNAISNLTGTTPGLLGIILFIAGLTGMFFYSRRK
ncbi:MAG TPA: hypothetical protein ENH99_00755 [Candidatus Pacearchaeota archaeon]|nr:hypothetical protein [Candidatus Pacearchaeota archaeon]